MSACWSMVHLGFCVGDKIGLWLDLFFSDLGSKVDPLRFVTGPCLPEAEVFPCTDSQRLVESASHAVSARSSKQG